MSSGQQNPPSLAALALVASVPPTGNGPMVGRFLRRSPIASIKITYAFIAGAFKTNAALCWECFFSNDFVGILPPNLLMFVIRVSSRNISRDTSASRSVPMWTYTYAFNTFLLRHMAVVLSFLNISCQGTHRLCC